MKLSNFKKDSILLIILFCALVIWSWNIGSTDLVNDAALYSFRSLGYYDSLASDEQTTPIQWFNEIPWWANFSFHDAPPLVFVIQKISFSIFGDNILAARIPFVISGLLTLFLIYLILRQLTNIKVARFAAVLMAFLSFGTWSIISGYLEGIEMLFITLTLYFWIKYIRSDRKYYLYWWGLGLGLALLCKYTAIFLLPLFIIHALIYRRKVFRLKEFYLACLIVLIVLTPVIIYNIGVWQTRGHFDAALSSMLGQEHQDFFSLRGRKANFNLLSNLRIFITNLSANLSPPVLILFALSLIYLVYLLFTKKKEAASIGLILLGFFFLVLLFIVSGLGLRFMPIYIPFIILIIAFGTYQFYQIVKAKGYARILIYLLVISLAWEFTYNINSNFLIKPLTQSPLLYTHTNLTSRKRGFNALEKYLKANVLPQGLKFARPTKLEDIDHRSAQFLAQNSIMYFYDETANWFAHNWYFRKYSNYYGLPMLPFYQQAKRLEIEDPIAYFTSLGVYHYYYIHAVDDSVLDPVKTKSESRIASNGLAKVLDSRGIEAEEIKNYQGEVVFRVYKFSSK